MKKNKIFIACDTTNIKKIKELNKELDKVNKELANNEEQLTKNENELLVYQEKEQAD